MIKAITSLTSDSGLGPPHTTIVWHTLEVFIMYYIWSGNTRGYYSLNHRVVTLVADKVMNSG